MLKIDRELTKHSQDRNVLGILRSNQSTHIPGTARRSSVVIHNGTAYLKGVTARGGPKDIAGHTKSCLDQIDALLSEVGSRQIRVLQMTIWLRYMADFDAMNAVYDAWVVRDAEPVRACVEAELASPTCWSQCVYRCNLSTL